MGLEIERKFLVKKLPENLEQYPVRRIEQGYLNVHPAIRVRRDNDEYYMTYKGMEKLDGGMTHAEYNLDIDEASYRHLLEKADGNIIRKNRYVIPINTDAFSHLTKEQTESLEQGNIFIELDVFDTPFDGMIVAEVEFPNSELAKAYQPADWFGEEVTGRPEYSNARMTQRKF